MSDNFASTTCRLCSRKGVYDMFEHRLEINEDNLVLISEAYQMFSSVKIDNQTIAPMLCAYCTEELGQAYNFYVKVKLSESDLNEVDDDEIDQDLIEIDETIDDELTKDDGDEDYFEMIVNEITEDENEELDLVARAEEIPLIPEKQSKVEAEHIIVPETSSKKFNKIPNIQLTSKVSTLLNRITKSGTLLQKRKSLNTDVEDSSVSRKVQKLDENFIMAPKFVLYETRFEDKMSPDGLNDVNNGISEISDESIFSSGGGGGLVESSDVQKQNLNKRKMPALPTHKVTMDIAAVRLETNSTQLDIYSKLDRKEDASVLYQCSYCPKAFATQYHLGLHTQKVHVCQHCLTGFNKIQDLYAHVKAEHNTFICSFCNKQMSTNSNLRAHVRKIHGVALPAGVSLISLQK